jgi:hypothetical protein
MSDKTGFRSQHDLAFPLEASSPKLAWKGIGTSFAIPYRAAPFVHRRFQDGAVEQFGGKENVNWISE